MRNPFFPSREGKGEKEFFSSSFVNLPPDPFLSFFASVGRERPSFPSSLFSTSQEVFSKVHEDSKEWGREGEKLFFACTAYVQRRKKRRVSCSREILVGSVVLLSSVFRSQRNCLTLLCYSTCFICYIPLDSRKWKVPSLSSETPITFISYITQRGFS